MENHFRISDRLSGKLVDSTLEYSLKSGVNTRWQKYRNRRISLGLTERDFELDLFLWPSRLFKGQVRVFQSIHGINGIHY